MCGERRDELISLPVFWEEIARVEVDDVAALFHLRLHRVAQLFACTVFIVLYFTRDEEKTKKHMIDTRDKRGKYNNQKDAR